MHFNVLAVALLPITQGKPAGGVTSWYTSEAYHQAIYIVVKNKRPYILLLKMKETLGFLRRDLVTIEMHSFFGVVINYEFNSPSSF